MNKLFKLNISFTFEGNEQELDKLFDRCIFLYDTELKLRYKVDNFVIGSKPITTDEYE